MPYPQQFFTVQLAFAAKMAELTGQPYAEAVMENTALYRILGLDWSFDASNPVWREFVQGLSREETAEGKVDWTYRFYLGLNDDIPAYNRPRWGCFSYEYIEDVQVIRIHFSNLDASGYGPLATVRVGARMMELASMFSHIREAHPDARVVRGGTWLYNRKEYTRLFPPEYAQSARADTAHLRGHVRARGLWGQFLRHGNRINEQVAALFLERVARLEDSAQFGQCFPYLALTTEAPIETFYRFYSVTNGDND